MHEFGMEMKVAVLRLWLGAMGLVLSMASNALAIEIRTYEFVIGDEYNYSSDCGECSLQFTTRARVEGQFQVLLDTDLGTGVLQSLDATLVDIETLTGSLNGPVAWLPSPDRPLFVDALTNHAYRPPLAGMLVSIGEDLILTSHSQSTLSEGQFSLPPTFQVTLSGKNAAFDFFMPLIELNTQIIQAKAKLTAVIPEPSSLLLAALTFAVLLCRPCRY